MTRAVTVVLAGYLAVMTNPAVSAAAPDTDAVAKAGEDNAERLLTTAASWKSIMTYPDGRDCIIETIKSPSAARYKFSVKLGGQTFVLWTIIERDGFWYATGEDRRAKYRPYELATASTLFYLCMARSEPHFLSKALLPELGAVVESTDTGMTFAALPSAADAALVNKEIKSLRSLVAEARDSHATAEVDRAQNVVKDLQQSGIRISVDLKTGLLADWVGMGSPTHFADFVFLRDLDKKVFEVGDGWEDCSDDPTLGNLDDLLLINHFAAWRPGSQANDLDGRLMDVSTGRFRRVPFRSGQFMPSCFLKGRKSVVVSGANAFTSQMRPFIVDLATGTNKPIESPELESGTTVGGRLSPDGRKLVFLHKELGFNALEFQALVVDIETGKSERVGDPMFMGEVSWMPDGKHLLTVRREPKGDMDVVIGHVCVMDMRGVIKALLPGERPVLLADGKSILFQDQSSNKWWTCDLDGADLKLFGNGLADYFDPAPAPDGKRIVMKHIHSPDAPVPTILHIGESDGTPLTTVPGMWAYPVWR